jgi:hypothetical protein
MAMGDSGLFGTNISYGTPFNWQFRSINSAIAPHTQRVRSRTGQLEILSTQLAYHAIEGKTRDCHARPQWISKEALNGQRQRSPKIGRARQSGGPSCLLTNCCYHASRLWIVTLTSATEDADGLSSTQLWSLMITRAFRCRPRQTTSGKECRKKTREANRVLTQSRSAASERSQPTRFLTSQVGEWPAQRSMISLSA